MSIKVTHCGTIYTCETAIKCTCDNFIKLFDANGVEIVSFENISNFDDFTISGGSFTDPQACAFPIPLTTYVISGKTISPSGWVNFGSIFKHSIQNNLFSANEKTCDIFLIFQDSHCDFEYQAEQKNGEIVLYVEKKPEVDIVIDSIKITRV